MILAEQLLLLFLDDEKGHERASWGGDPGLAGALLLDLTPAGGDRGSGRQAGRRRRPASTIPSSPPPTRRSPPTSKRRDAKGWVDRLPSELKPLKERIAGGLVERGVLSEERRKVLGLFRTTRFPEADPEPERELRERLRAVLLSERQPTPEDAMLIGLLRPYDLPEQLVPKERRKDAKRRAEEVAEGGTAAKAVAGALQEIQGAILASVAISAATVAITSGN